MGLHVEIARDREQPVEHLPDAEFAHRLAAHRLADRAQRRRELLDAVIVGDVLRLEMNLGDASVIAGREAIENRGGPAERKGVVWGKSVAVRVYMGGGGVIKKKNK